MAGMGPTVRARRLGQRLRELREDHRLSQKEAAAQIHRAASTLNRFETAAEVPGPDMVRALGELYGAPDTAQLIQLARDAKSRGWWTAYGDLFQGTYVMDEDVASRIRTWQGVYIPGLLQTADYARAVITAGQVTGGPDGVQRRVQARMARRELLARDDPQNPPPALDAIMDESALHRAVCPPAAMATQLRYLLQGRPNVKLRVLPYGAGAVAAMDGRFTILDFPPGFGFDPEVYGEHIAGEVYLESLPLIERAKVAFEQAADAALSPEESLALIRAACERYT